MNFIWEQRIAGKTAMLQPSQAELIANVALLRNTKWKHFTLHNNIRLNHKFAVHVNVEIKII
jgi:hypothetical protein